MRLVFGHVESIKKLKHAKYSRYTVCTVHVHVLYRPSFLLLAVQILCSSCEKEAPQQIHYVDEYQPVKIKH